MVTLNTLAVRTFHSNLPNGKGFSIDKCCSVSRVYAQNRGPHGCIWSALRVCVERRCKEVQDRLGREGGGDGGGGRGCDDVV